jgi:hypothetical protein
LLGSFDAAAPVPQTLSVQGVVAGTTDTAGADFTIAMSQSTGTGLPGNLVIKGSSIAGSTASTQNALATVATFYGYRATYAGSGTPTSGLDVAGYLSVGALVGPGGSFTGVKIGGIGNPDAWIGSGGVAVRNNYSIAFASSTNPNNSGTWDTIATRRGVANWCHGAADAAAPVAQTLSVQGVVAGTLNTAGTLFTIQGSLGTGTGTPGAIKFQTGKTLGTGTVQQTPTDAFWIGPLSSTGVLDVRFGEALTEGFKIQQSGIQVLDVVTNNATMARFLSAGMNLGPAWLGFNATIGNGADVKIQRRAAANLLIGDVDAASPTAQTISFQGVIAGTLNTAGVNATFVGSPSTGNATGGGFIFQTSPSGSSGTAQNSAETTLTITNRNVQLGTNTVMNIGSTVFLGSGASFNFTSVSANIRSGPSTGIIQIGAADSSGPVDSGISAQSASGGNANLAGPNFYYMAGKSTGSAAGGSHIFQVSPAGGSSSSQNALATALTIDSTKLATFAGTVNAPNFIGTVQGSGFADAAGVLANQTIDIHYNTTGVFQGAGRVFGWSSASTNLTSQDTGLSRITAGVVGVGTGAAGQTTGQLYAATVRTGQTTVAALPSASTAGAGARAFVTDATATTFLSTVAGGGANKVPVVSDGTNWLIG